jgi:hypothetical protein
MRNMTKSMAFGVVLLVLLQLQPLTGQVPGASPATLGTANNYTVLARGFAAVGLNPAGLGMSEIEGPSLALFPIQIRRSLDPLGVSDYLDYEGEVVPDAVKEDWLQRISEAGGQTGGGTVEITPFSLSWNRLGFQLSTIASGFTNLNPAAAELLFFGNSGRTGSPGNFDLAGSTLNGFAVTTFAISGGFPISRRWAPGVEQGLALGATLKSSWGHALVFAEDAGSSAQGDPLSLNLDFPMIYSASDAGFWSGGSGLGIDVGGIWKRDAWSVAAVITNLVNNFEWDLGNFSWRQGRAFLDSDSTQTDLDEQPGREAPQGLKDRVEELTFEPAVTVSGAYSGFENLTITAEVRQRAGEGLDVGPKSHIGMGLEYLPTPVFPLRAGFAVITDGFQAGGGFGLNLGPIQIGASALYETRDSRTGLAGMVGIALVSR